MKPSDFKHAPRPLRAVGAVPFAATLRLPLAPSARFLRGLFLVHLVVAGLLLHDLAHQPLAWLLAVATALHAPMIARQWRDEAAPFHAAQLDAEGGWWLVAASGALQPARLGATRFVTAWWMLLPLVLCNGTGRVTLCLMRDNLAPDEFRRLRVRLLWGRLG